jgi:hypothetical protein
MALAVLGERAIGAVISANKIVVLAVAVLCEVTFLAVNAA